MSHSFFSPAARVIAVMATCGCAGFLVTACSSSSDSGSFGRAAAPAAPAAGAVNGPDMKAARGSSADLVSLAPVQSIIYTANLTIRVRNVTAAASAASSDVTAVGGYIASERQTVPQSRHQTGSVSLQLKIPVSVYQTTLAKLSALGRTVSFSTQAQDVTQQVADVSSRVASAEAAIKQLRALLSRAGSVSGLLSVQDEINTQQSALEALLAQQQALDRETSDATVTLQVNGPRAAPVIKKKAHHGLAAGLGTGWRGLKVTVVWLLTALGTILPFAVPIALIGGAVVIGRRRIRRRRTAQAAGTP